MQAIPNICLDERLRRAGAGGQGRLTAFRLPLQDFLAGFPEGTLLPDIYDRTIQYIGNDTSPLDEAAGFLLDEAIDYMASQVSLMPEEAELCYEILVAPFARMSKERPALKDERRKRK